MKWTDIEEAYKACKSLDFVANLAGKIVIKTTLKGELELKEKEYLSSQTSPEELHFILTKLEKAGFIYLFVYQKYNEDERPLWGKGSKVKINRFFLEDEDEPLYFSPEINLINEIDLISLDEDFIWQEYRYELIPTDKLISLPSVEAFLTFITSLFDEKHIQPKTDIQLVDGLLTDQREKSTVRSPARQGQQEFSRLVREAYGYQCAITQCDAQQALEAAHIIPYKGSQSNQVWNGILLRADIHKLFDIFLLAIHPDTKEVCINIDLVNSYNELAGQKIHLPKEPELQPHNDVLQWHYNQHRKQEENRASLKQRSR